MSSEVTFQVIQVGVTSIPGKGTLGTRRFRASHVHPGTELEALPDRVNAAERTMGCPSKKNLG